jgi:hypothetical protein
MADTYYDDATGEWRPIEEYARFPAYTLDVSHFEPLHRKRAHFVGYRPQYFDEVTSTASGGLYIAVDGHAIKVALIDAAQRHGPSLPSVREGT